jgi:hypothetical protein
MEHVLEIEKKKKIQEEPKKEIYFRTVKKTAFLLGFSRQNTVF